MTQPTKAGKAIAIGLSLGALGAFTWWALRSRTSYYDAWAQQMDGGLQLSDFDPDALAEGQVVEVEHGAHPQIATEAAMDHLVEDPQYYQKLSIVEHATTPEQAAEGFRQILEAS